MDGADLVALVACIGTAVLVSCIGAWARYRARLSQGQTLAGHRPAPSWDHRT